MSTMEVFTHPISDKRSDEAIMLYTDITSFFNYKGMQSDR